MYIELNLPEQKLNDWAIESFQQDGRKYQKLTKGGITWMVNTPDIVKDFVDFLTRAEGSILINGLGIGMCCHHLLAKDTVTDLTVIEYEKDIVELIAPHFEVDPRCTIIHGDAYTYEPPSGKIYDYVWHDVWTYVSTRNLEEYERLYNKYRNIAKWQDGWNLQAVRALIEETNNIYRRQSANLAL